MRDAHRGDVHPALAEHLIEREFGGLILAEIEFDAFGHQPLVYGLRLGVAHRAHFGHQRRLAQPLLEDSRGIDQLVVDDGVVHAHAALIEDAHDGLTMLHLRS